MQSFKNLSRQHHTVLVAYPLNAHRHPPRFYSRILDSFQRPRYDIFSCAMARIAIPL
jgi:hypothetical protein